MESLGELLTALARGHYDEVLGTPEADDLDFKEQPYQLEDDKGKWQLCKDVAALANTDGGCLVIGYSVRRGPTDVAEVADELRPVPVALVNPDQYKKTLSSGVYPPPSVKLHSFTEGLGEGRQVFVIEVKKDTVREPFIVRRMPDAKEKYSTEAIGIPSRFHDDTLWRSAEEIYQWIREQGVSTVPEADEEASEPREVDVARWQSEFEERSQQRLRQIIDLQDWESTPTYSLHAAPAPSDHQLRDLHDPSGLAGVIQHPRSLRPTGFGLVIGTTEVIDGALVGRSPRGPVVWLDPDGFITAASAGNRDFLGWAVNDGVTPQRPWTLINSLVLVEFTLEFFRLVHSALVPRIRGPWLHGVHCTRFQSGQLRLAPGFRKSVVGLWEENTSPASSENWWRSFVDNEETVPTRNAARALEFVYQLFGLPPSAIPFTDKLGISEDALLQA